MAKILLLEPRYKNKYPSLALMKLATYHENDEVYLRKGQLKVDDPEIFDRVYVASLFTFEWKKTIEAIEYAKKLVINPKKDIYVGGVAATLLADEFREATGVQVVTGLLTSDTMIGYNRGVDIDRLTPNYAILEQVESDQYKYPLNNAYIGYMTRGCKNKCGFCAVNTIEPNYIEYVPLKKQIEEIKMKYGPKKDLVLNDNNVFASDRFFEIIDEIKELGFETDKNIFHESPNKIKPKRYVDFNQGLDARFVTPEKMKKLSEIAIKPARIAFDDIKFQKIYERAIRLAAQNDIKHLSNYILYNYNDTPEDFYTRLEINVNLNQELGTSIYSFPMKFVPLTQHDRKYVGPNWSPKQLRGVQCILNATMGKVGPRKEFFHAAFGDNVKEFKEIILMPEEYILYRAKNKKAADSWRDELGNLSDEQQKEFFSIIKENKFKDDVRQTIKDKKIKKILGHYYK